MKNKTKEELQKLELIEEKYKISLQIKDYDRAKKYFLIINKLKEELNNLTYDELGELK